MRRKSARKPRVDWVYHDDSYNNSTFNLAGGNLNAVLATLVDSQTAMRFLRYGAVGVAPNSAAAALPTVIQGEWERPERSRIIVRAVQWLVHCTPNTWASNSIHEMGVRVGAYEQDPQAGLGVVPASYGIWNLPAIVSGLNAAANANERRLNWKEWRFARSFNTTVTSPVLQYSGFWKGRWALDSGDQAALWMEVPTSSVTSRVLIYARTLVEMPR